MLVNLFGAILLLVAPDGAGWLCWEFLVMAYGSIRIYEIVVYQINVVLFDAHRTSKTVQQHKLRGYRRLVILLLLNYVELIFWFAVLYRHMSDTFLPVVDTYWSALAVSFTTMSGLGPATSSSTGGSIVNAALYAQAVVGLFMTLVVLARFISILPQPKSADKHEQNE